jgi:hypothetical protein
MQTPKLSMALRTYMDCSLSTAIFDDDDGCPYLRSIPV